ncbi:UNVERIFIED_CONTAM: putative ribonuclease H protein [Sesamum radiatum]|uniref:Ribonuclease H protein n=1 Tax=Sesamum radiatum TaxID=300843 RepID=A0AAW2KAL9_SESRA
MPLYIMQVLSPPISVIQKLEQLLAKYFWGSTDSQKKIHWTRWSNVCYPIEEGELGIRNFRDTVEVFSYKLWWRLRLNDSLCALFTMNKCCRANAPATAKVSPNDSPIWRRLCKVRHVVQNNMFWTLGKGEEEAVYHLFLQNNHSLTTWKFFAGKFNITLPQSSIIPTFIQAWKLNPRHSLKLRDVIPMIILWNIWTSRNDAKHRKKPFNAQVIISKTWYHLQNLCRSNIWKPEHLKGDAFAVGLLKLKIPETQNYQNCKTVYWLKPDPGWVKLNTNGASKGNPGLAGAGGNVREYEGKVIFAFSEPIGLTNNMVAEMHVVLRGLGICLKKGFSKVWLELDALYIIHLISKQVRGAWYIQNMLQHIQYLQQMEVRISHIFREENQAADYFANQALEIDEISIINHDQLEAGSQVLLKWTDFPCHILDSHSISSFSLFATDTGYTVMNQINDLPYRCCGFLWCLFLSDYPFWTVLIE